MIQRDVQRLARSLITHKLTLTVCESCTAGMLGAMLTRIPGSSHYFLGGIIAYSNAMKQRLVGVHAHLLKRHGAVSRQVARDMAENIRKKCNASVGVSITGIAGPTGGTTAKPVGLVYIGVADGKRVLVQRFVFRGSRNAIRRAACTKALALIQHVVGRIADTRY